MVVRLHGETVLHRAVRADEDPRLAWTRCGIRFAWGEPPRGAGKLAMCGGCR